MIGEYRVELGGEEQHVRYGIDECCALQDLIEGEPISYLAQSKSVMNLVVNMLVVGLSSTNKKKPVSPKKVRSWLAESDHDVDDLARELLYAYAKGLPKANREKTVAVLDEAFPAKDGDDPLE
jgi:hypothetical protein